MFGNKYSAHRDWCNCNFKVDNKGKAALTQHEGVEKHKDLKKNLDERQRTFDENAQLSPNKLGFTNDELTTRAEILEALKAVKQIDVFRLANSKKLSAR